MKLARLLIPSLIVLGSAAALAQSSPVIVAQVSLLKQSQPIRTTNLYTPSTSGVYRVNAYMATPNSSFTGAWSVRLTWQDDESARTTPKGWLFVGDVNIHSSQATQIVRAVAGQPITYLVSANGPPTFTYNLFITVEQLESDAD